MELGALQNQAPDPEEFRGPPTTNATTQKETPGKIDMEAYNKASAEHQQKVDGVIQRYKQQTMGLTTAQTNVVGGQQSTVQSPDELRSAIFHGAIKIGDTVMTPAGPRPLTQEVYNKLMDN
jgi:hypothetical protein